MRKALIVAACLLVVPLGAAIVAERHLSAAPDGCAACHPMRRYVASFQTGRDLDAAHRRANVGCYDCHQGYSLTARTRTAALYVVGAVGEPKRRRYDEAAHTDLLLRNPHLSHWPELVCADCHLAHGAQIDFCSQCHDNGGQRMTGDPVVSRAPNRWWSAAE